MITKANIQSRLTFWMLGLICVFLPTGLFVPVFIAVLFANWLVQGDFANKFSAVPKRPLLLFAGLYLVYVVGLLFTQNIESGWFDLEVKLSLLIFPIVLLTTNLTGKQYSILLSVFILGNCVAALICFANALLKYFINGEAHFFYGTFSIFLHPSYFAMYLNFCVVIVLLSFSKLTFSIAVSKGWKITVLVFLSAIIFLLSSKAGLITLVLIYVIALLAFVYSSKKYLIGVGVLLLMSGSFYLLLKNVPEVAGRFNNSLKIFSETQVDKTSSESNSVRLFIWQKDIEVIKENLWTGVGTGDVKDELLKKYIEAGITGAYKTDLATNKIISVLNAHNQFFQTFIAIGLLGFLLFIIGFIYPFILSVKNKNYVYMCFLFIIIVNFLTESMLETQAGVLFYAFFNSLLYKVEPV